MRHTTVFDTPQPLIYHICTALKPKVCILCHITSYTTPSASFNFDQTSTRYCFQMQLQNKHRQYETHDRLRYIPAPYIPHMYSFEAKSMQFMSYNFLYDPLSLFQFRSNFTKVLLLDVFKINIDSMRHTTVFDTPQPLIYHICTALKQNMHFMSYNFLYDPLSLFQFRSNFNKVGTRPSSIHPSPLYTTYVQL